MKQDGKKIQIQKHIVEGGAGGKLVVEYTSKAGGIGTLELKDLGPIGLIY